MSLLLSMLPLYLLGNFHCIGMCGPLVMMLGSHPYRLLYFIGRLASFTLMAGLAGGAGALLYDLFRVSAWISFLFGGGLLLMGIWTLMRWPLPAFGRGVGQKLSLLLLKEEPWPTFLFGFFTVLLPCGQTLLVFSACALYGDLTVGLLNGFAFALLTSPSLFLAMHMHSLLGKAKRYYNVMLGIFACLVGFLAICRGFAEMGVISHLVVNAEYHVMLF